MLQLREYETRTVFLTDEQRTELAALTRANLAGAEGPRIIQSLTPSTSPQCFDIQPGPYVGRFTLDCGVTIDIGSRFPFANLVDLLRVAARQPALLHPAPVPARGGHGLIELIAIAFAREAERIVGFGLAKSYQVRTFTRPPYPGVPDATAHLARHLGRPDRLVTRARRLTSDIPVNQVLAAAHRVLRGQSYANPTITVRLRALGPAFTHITTVAEPLRTARPAVGHAITRYREALALAVLVLTAQTTLPTGTGRVGSSVLFNMTKVWEDYVQAWVQHQLPNGHNLSVQHPIILTDDESQMTASADLVEFDGSGQPTAVYDAKYKPWGKTPSASDLYQVITYAHRLGVSRAFLLYPGHGEHNEVIVGSCRVAMLGIPVLSMPGLVNAQDRPRSSLEVS